MKRGFTLVEMLGAIAILAILVAVAYPTIKDAYENSKSKISDKQVSSLEEVARMWGAKNTDRFSETSPYYLTIEELKRSGLAENKDIINPNTKEQLKGCIKISYSSNKYNYTYDIYENVEGCH